MSRTEIAIVLDRSGSMNMAKDDHEGGLRSFVREQRELEGDVRFTLIQFDSQNPCEVVYDGTPIAEVGEISLIPRGGTPLNDAIGKAVAHLEARLKREKVKPDLTVCMVITDGEENASREMTKPMVQRLVKRKGKEGWTFLFLGANIDAFKEGASYGVSAQNTMSFQNQAGSANSVYGSTSANLSRARLRLAMAAPPEVVIGSFAYNDAQRSAAMGETPAEEPEKEKTTWTSTS